MIIIQKFRLRLCLLLPNNHLFSVIELFIYEILLFQLIEISWDEDVDADEAIHLKGVVDCQLQMRDVAHAITSLGSRFLMVFSIKSNNWFQLLSFRV